MFSIIFDILNKKLDEKLKISVEGKVSSNLVEKVVETVPITRKVEEVIEITTNKEQILSALSQLLFI